MSQTLSNLSDIVRETWTPDRLQKMFYNEFGLLDRIERSNKYTIGNEAKVPLHKGRSGGISIKSAAGGALNGADEQKVDKATYSLSYTYGQIELEMAVLNQANTNAQVIAGGLELEVSGMVDDMRRQVLRQLVSNGDALIARCDASSSGQAVVGLQGGDDGGLGTHATEIGWLYPDLPVDIGTTADEVAIVDGGTIAAVSESDTTPTITLSANLGANVTTSHYVSIKDARSGTTSYETNGLRQIFGSSTSSVGGLDPDTTGEGFWKPAHVNTSSTVLDLDVLRTASRKVFKRTGKRPGVILTSPKQADNYDALLQNQVRFSSDRGKTAGNVDNNTWGGILFEGIPDIPDHELYLVDLDSLIIVHGKYDGPTWKSSLMGVNRGLQDRQGHTSFVDTAFISLNLGTKDRRRGAAFTNLYA